MPRLKPMAKRRKRQKPKARPRQKTPTTANRTDVGRHIRPIAKAVGALIVALVGLVGVGIEAWPNVRGLPPDEAIDLNEPYKQPFSLRNSGNLPVYDAEVQCYPQHESVYLAQVQNLAIRVKTFRFIAGRVSHGDQRPFTCDSLEWISGIGPEGKNFALPHHITAADLIVTIRFRVVSFIPWWWSVTQVFITHTEDVTKKTYWREYRPPLR